MKTLTLIVIKEIVDTNKLITFIVGSISPLSAPKWSIIDTFLWHRDCEHSELQHSLRQLEGNVDLQGSCEKRVYSL